MTNEEFEPIRIRIMKEAYDLADKNDTEGYNSVKVMCSDIQNLMHRKPLTLEEGMTLRDYFAAKAMQGMLANPKLQEQILKAGQSWIEKSAWSVADAMLKERNNE